MFLAAISAFDAGDIGNAQTLLVSYIQEFNSRQQQGAAAAASPEVKDVAEAFYTLGLISRDCGGASADAKTYFTQAIQLQESVSRYWRSFGEWCCDAGHLENGLAACLKAIELDRQDTSAHCALAKVLAKQGKQKEARVACANARKTDPEEAQSFMMLGQCEQGAGKLQAAIAALEKAVAQLAKRTQARAAKLQKCTSLQRLLIQKQQKADSIMVLRVRLLLGQCHAQKNRHALALTCYSTAIAALQQTLAAVVVVPTTKAARQQTHQQKEQKKEQEQVQSPPEPWGSIGKELLTA